MGRMAAVLGLALLTAACSTEATTGSSDARSATPSSPAATETPDGPGTGTGGPSAGSGEPAVLDAFPHPDELGAGWEYRVDPGDAEAGYEGTGSPAVPRDPDEVTGLAVPLGCPRPATMPTARTANEVDYAFEGRSVVALRLEYASVRQAAEFVAARRANLRACLGLSGGPAVGPYVANLDGPVNDRTPDSEPWTEAVLRKQAAVLLLAVQGPIDQHPFDLPKLRRLVSR